MSEDTNAVVNGECLRGRVPTRTIAFLNQKGGVGKTTTVVNLASAMALAGRRVGVIDLDPQSHLTLHLGIDGSGEGATVYDVLIDDEVGASEAFCEVRPNLFVLPAEVDLAAAETELAGTGDRHQRLARKIRACGLANDFEFLLIDCPPSLGLLTLNALTLAREVFVPMQAHFLALQGLSRLLETVGMVSQQVNPTLQVAGIVLCMFEGNTRLAGEVVGDLTEFFDSQRDIDVPWRRCRLLQPPIRRNIKLAESPSFGQSIFDYDPSCPGAQDYRLLAENLLGEWDAFLNAREKQNVSGEVSQIVEGKGEAGMVDGEISEQEIVVCSTHDDNSPADAAEAAAAS